MIEVDGLSKIFATAEVKTVALANITICIREGDFVAITGPSGSGKSTLLNILGLLEPASSGKYLFDALDVTKLNERERSRIRLEKMGFVFQAYNLLPELTVEQNVEIPLRYLGVPYKERRLRVKSMLRTIGLASRASHLPHQLSGGQQQRTSVARAVISRPKLILADEPTGNLDSEMTRQLLSLFRSINSEGSAIVLVTHDEYAANTADHRIHIADGRITSEQGYL